jgi:hypothetical protein
MFITFYYAQRNKDIISFTVQRLGRLYSMCPAKVAFWRWDVEKLMSSHDLQIPVKMLSTPPTFAGKTTWRSGKLPRTLW